MTHKDTRQPRTAYLIHHDGSYTVMVEGDVRLSLAERADLLKALVQLKGIGGMLRFCACWMRKRVRWLSISSQQQRTDGMMTAGDVAEEWDTFNEQSTGRPQNRQG